MSSEKRSSFSAFSRIFVSTASERGISRKTTCRGALMRVPPSIFVTLSRRASSWDTPRSAVDQHRDARVHQYPVRLAAEQQPAEAAAPVRRHQDEIAPPRFRGRDNSLPHVVVLREHALERHGRRARRRLDAIEIAIARLARALPEAG